MPFFKTPRQSVLARSAQGAALAEYAILLGLIGIAVIASVASLGERISGVFQEAEIEVEKRAGEDTPGAIAFGIEPGQIFEIPAFGRGGDALGAISVTGAPTGFTLGAGGSGLLVDSGGALTALDPAAFGPPGTEQQVAVTMSTRDGTAQGTIGVVRLEPVDLADDATTTGRIALGETVSGLLESGDSGDWFALPVDIAGDLQVILQQYSGGDLDLYFGVIEWPMITLRDADGDMVMASSEDTFPRAAILYNDLEAGTYYLDVQKSWRGADGAYDLSAALVEDIRSSTATTETLREGDIRYERLAFGDERDMFRFELDETEHVQFVLDGNVGLYSGSDVTIDLLGSDGRLMDLSVSVIGQEYAALLVNDLPAGTYYVGAGNPGGKFKTDYSISATKRPDDIRSNTTTLAVLHPEQGHAEGIYSSLVLGDESDWFRLEVEDQSGGPAILEFRSEAIQGDLGSMVAGLRDASGRNVDVTAVLGTGSVKNYRFDDVAAGTYYLDIRKSKYYDRREGSFWMSVAYLAE